MRFRLLLLLAILPLPAVGQGFGPIRWDYVRASILAPAIDELGIEIEGSTAVTPDLVVFGGYRDFKPDNRVDRKTLQIGVGYRWNFRPNVDFMVSLSYADNTVEHPVRNLDEEGLILGGHLRGWLTQRIELSGAILLDNSLGSSTDTVVEFGGQFFQGRNWSYGARIRADEDDETYAVGVNFFFGASRR